MLTQQTFPLYTLLPVAWAARWDRSLLAALPPLTLASPWYLLNLEHQLLYSAESAAYSRDSGVLAHLFYYPWALLGLTLGPVWTVITCGAGILGYTRRSLLLLAGIWLLGGILALTAIPKKYDRRLTPLLPAAGLLIAAGAAACPRAALLVVGATWTPGLSYWPSPLAAPPKPVIDFEPGCIQTWFTPPGAARRRAPGGC